MSLERERFLALLLDCLAPAISRPGVLLDIAPSDRVTPLLLKLEPALRIGLDFDPSADGRLIDVQASVTDLPLESDSVDLMVCYHVLEHVPDDRAAMREIARALRPNGVAVIQVPWRSHEETDEDPSASPQERRVRFGQVDHVRWYGSDFESRLSDAGLSVRRVTPGQLLGAAGSSWFHLNENESVWLCSPSLTEQPGRVTEVITTGSLMAALSYTQGEVQRLQKSLDSTERKWQSRYRQLDEHRALRLYRRVRPWYQAVRRAGSAVRRRAASLTSRTGQRNGL